MSVNAPNEQLDLIAPDFELLSVDNNKYSLILLLVRKEQSSFLFVITAHM